MAGEWLPMRLDLDEDPAVIHIQAATGLDAYEVIGRLWKLWRWANRQLENGHAHSVTEKWIDAYTGATGFSQAMVGAGWLEVDSTGVTFPKFDVWNSKSAKRRLLATRRQQAKRHANVTPRARQKRDQKREDKSNTPLPPKGGRDELFDAIAEVTGLDAATAGSHLGKVAATLRKAAPAYTPAEVREFGRRFGELCPHAVNNGSVRLPGAGELERYIGRVRKARTRTAPTDDADTEQMRRETERQLREAAERSKLREGDNDAAF